MSSLSLSLALVVLLCVSSYGEVVTVAWENFTLVQEGEWMLEL
jgi:hypothetical protein